MLNRSARWIEYDLNLEIRLMLFGKTYDFNSGKGFFVTMRVWQIYRKSVKSYDQ